MQSVDKHLLWSYYTLPGAIGITVNRQKDPWRNVTYHLIDNNVDNLAPLNMGDSQ